MMEMTTESNESYYIKNHYGKCKISPCKCLKERWQGVFCSNWEPVKENSFREMVERLKKESENVCL